MKVRISCFKSQRGIYLRRLKMLTETSAIGSLRCTGVFGIPDSDVRRRRVL